MSAPRGKICFKCGKLESVHPRGQFCKDEDKPLHPAFTSQAMIDTKREIQLAVDNLDDSDWGDISLESAANYLKSALDYINIMRDMK